MNEDAHVGQVASALVMLAAVATTFNVYAFYQDDKLATAYEADYESLDQTASALVSLRLQEAALMAASTTPEVETKAEVE